MSHRAWTERVQEITAPRALVLKTPLVAEGQAQAMLVAPADEIHQRLTRPIQEKVQEATGVRLPIRRDDEVTAADWERNGVIALGNLMTSRFVERLYRMNYVHADARYPGPGGFVTHTVHDPWGTGENVIFLGGSDAAGVAAAVAHFVGLIRPSADLTMDQLMTIRLGDKLKEESFALPPDVDAVRSQLKRASNRELTRRAGEYGFNYALGGQADWALCLRDAFFEHRSRPYVGWDDTHIELWYALIGFDLAEASPALSDEDRLALTRYLLQVLRGPEGTLQPAFRGALGRQTIRHNHAMQPALAAYFGGQYFKKYCGLKEAEAWIRDAAELFKGQERAFKTECDATAYESTSALPLPAIYALAELDYAFFPSGALAKALDRMIGCMDNRFELSGNGDAGPAFPMPLLLMANWFYRDGRYQWIIDRRREVHGERAFGKALRYYIDGLVAPVKPADLAGVRCFPVEPEFYRRWEGPETIPPERRFDKISFRADFDPDRQYLLLDGLEIGSHGHEDVNAIVRFTDHDRVFLVDDSYSEGPNLKDHNAVTVIRDGLRGSVPKAAELLNLVDLKQTGFSRTVARGYSGADWIRSIVWVKDAYFVVIDEVEAQEAGEYKMECLWRTLGEGALDGAVFRVRQAPSAEGEVVDDPRASGGKVLVFKGGALSTRVSLPEGDWEAYVPDDPRASGGKALVFKEGALSTRVGLPEGDYEVYVVGWGPDDASNSVWVEVDGRRLPAIRLSEGKPATAPPDPASLVRFWLDQGGRHRLTISLRENQPVCLDRLVLRSVVNGREFSFEAEAFRSSFEGRRDDFTVEGTGWDRVQAETADPVFSRFWAKYPHCAPTIQIVRQIALRRLAAGERHRFVNLFFASNAQDPRSFRLRPIEEGCALVSGDSNALVGAGPIRQGGLEADADLFHVSESRFALVGATRLRAGAPLFASRAPVAAEFDLAIGEGTAVAAAATEIGLPGTAIRIDGKAVQGRQEDGLMWVALGVGRHEVVVEGVPEAARQALRAAFAMASASAGEIAAGRTAALSLEGEGLETLWRHEGKTPVRRIAIGIGGGTPMIFTGRGDGRVEALDRMGSLAWRHDLGAAVTALQVFGVQGKSSLFAGSEASHVCWLNADGTARWTVQIPPLHPTMRYRAPTRESDIGGILATEGEDGRALIFVGVHNGWLRCLDLDGKQHWEFFGNARAFDQLAVGDLEGQGERLLVATGKPSHFGSCIALTFAMEQKANVGLDGWARLTTQMRLDDVDGDGQAEAVCGTALGNLYLLKGSRLRTVWMAMLGDEVSDMALIGPEGDRKIAVTSRSFYVYSIGKDGDVRWATSLGDGTTHLCPVSRRCGAELATATADGRISLLAAVDGRVLARYPAGGRVVALAAADLDGDGEDEVVAGMEDGAVIALKRR